MRVKEMSYRYTKENLKKLYKQGEYYLGDWEKNGQIYLEKYDEYVQWITDYEQSWINVDGRFYALFDWSNRDNVPIVRGNFLVGFLLPNGEVRHAWASHFLTAEQIEATKERKMVSLSSHEETLPQGDTLEKLERELAALMQRVEDSFGVPPSFFEKN